MGLSLLLAAAALTCASATSPALDSFVDHLTGGSERTPGVKQCLSSSVHPRSGVLRDARHQPLAGIPDASVVTGTLTAYPDLATLLNCVLSSGEVPPAVLDVLGGPLLFSAAALIGATHGVPGGPAALFKAVLKAAPPGALRAASLQSDPGFTLAHHVVSTKSVIVGQLASFLLSLTDDRYGDRARAFAGELAESVAAALPAGTTGNGSSSSDPLSASTLAAATADAVRSAGRDMVAGLGRGGSLAQAPLLALRAGMSSVLLHILLLEGTTVAAAPSKGAVDAVLGAEGGDVTTVEPLAQPQRNGAAALAAMAATRDIYGRTPLHVAGALGDAHSASILLHALRLAGTSDAEVDALLRARDVAGWAAADLAEAISAGDAAAVLSWEERKSGGSERPPALAATSGGIDTSYGDNDSDNGGWSAAYVSPAAEAAVVAATAREERSTGGCDIAVIDAAALTADAFARAAYAPRLPVLVKRAFSPAAREAWRADRVIAEWGHAAVLPSAVPSGIPGGGGGQGGFGRAPPPPIALTTFIDALRLCDGGDPRENPPWLDAGTCAALAAPAGPASVWEALDSGDSADGLVIAAIDAALPSFLLAAALERNGSAALPAAAAGAAPVYLPASSGGHVTAQLYVGGPASGAAIHHHSDAWNGLAWGRKHWILEPPPRAEFSTRTTAAQYVQGLRRGPSSAPARLLECTQEAGDVLYVPRGWGHAAINLRASAGWAVEARGPFDRYH